MSGLERKTRVDDQLVVEHIDQDWIKGDFKDLKKFVADIATLSYGNDEAKNPERLFDRLRELKHESILEFVNLYPFLPEKKCNYAGSKRINASLRHLSDESFQSHWDLETSYIGKEALYNTYMKNVFTFKITAPIFVIRQFVRHRILSFLELSRRYVGNNKVPFKFYIPNNVNTVSQIIMKESNEESVRHYEQLLSEGVHTQLARSVLGTNLMTTIYVQGTKEEWQSFLNLRTKKSAQDEIRYVAEMIDEVVNKKQ